MLFLVEARKFSLKEAAKLAGVSESMIRLEIQRGELPVIRIGAKAMVVERDLEEYLRRHYVVEGASTARSGGCSSLPEWVEDSPFLKPTRKAS